MKHCITIACLMLLSVAAMGQTELYERYASQPGVKVASVSGFVIDSVSRVDVTLIEAEDDAGWEWMKQEFYIGDLSPQQQASLNEGYDAVLFARRSRSNPRDNAPVVGEQLDVPGSCYLGISYLSRTVYIFCADTEEQYDAVATLLVKKIMHQAR
ncbi:MAG: hypothetical protein J6X59_00970 [Bacteroidales bacterium]|nr:hypothetical protein [Bacteroidales bacterium]